jgi:hypothetical protein
MFISQSNIPKATSMILLRFIGYLFVINTFKYFTTGSFASPLIPKSSFEEIARTYLQFAIVLALSLVAAFLLHKRGNYIILTDVCIVVFVLVSYFAKWVM